jgi:hypothetical protein
MRDVLMRVAEHNSWLGFLAPKAYLPSLCVLGVLHYLWSDSFYR